MILYIAGPMTGRPDLNFPAFDAAARQLIDAGYEVLNPTRHSKGHPGWTWIDYLLLLCLRDVDRADGVALLTDWQTSKGAQVEFALASVQNKPTASVSTWLAQRLDHVSEGSV